MKRFFGYMVAATLAIVLVLSLAACGNANASKLEELDGLVSQYEGVVADAQVKVDELAYYVQHYDIMSYEENFVPIETTMKEIAAQKDGIISAYSENRDSYTSEKIDELIDLLSAQIESANKFVDGLKDLVTKAEESINGAVE